MTSWLIDTLIATSGLMLLVLLLRSPVRRWFGAPVAYALWLVPAARAILPTFTRTVERVVPVETPATMISEAPLTVMAPLPEAAFDWPSVLLATWMIGAAIMLARGILTYHRQRSGILEHAIQMARLGTIRIMRSERVRGPIAFGIVDQVIVVPLDFDENFSDRQRCFALEHELAHHRNGDMVANLFAFVLLCLQWFNPLAWAAHAAFRFDQEAACDARVLDKAKPGERASYGAAIAKAASGRTFLFSGVLDRPSTLSRRLTIMTNFQDSKRRRIGFALVGGGLLIALPLTASWAVRYVDIAPPAPIAAVSPAVAPIAPATGVAATPAVAPVVAIPAALAPVAGSAPADPNDHFIHDDGMSINDDSVFINGQRKRYEDLTPEERARVRTATAEARKSIDEEVRKLPEQMAEMEKTRQQFVNGDFKRQMAQAREEIHKAMAEIDSNSRLISATGQDVEKIRADLRKSLKEIDSEKIDETIRESLEGLNPEKLRASILEASQSIDRIEAKLNQLER